MNRRKYLAFSGTMTAAVAGCTALGRGRKITGDPSDEDSSVLAFTEEDEPILRIQLTKQFSDDVEREYYPFFIASWQPDGVQLDSLELRFRSPPNSAGFIPAGISLQEGAHADKATLAREEVDPSTTIVDLPETSDIGRGSVRIDLLLRGDQTQNPQELWIQAKATLSSEGFFGSEYDVRGDYTIAFP